MLKNSIMQKIDLYVLIRAANSSNVSFAMLCHIIWVELASKMSSSGLQRNAGTATKCWRKGTQAIWEYPPLMMCVQRNNAKGWQKMHVQSSTHASTLALGIFAKRNAFLA